MAQPSHQVPDSELTLTKANPNNAASYPHTASHNAEFPRSENDPAGKPLVPAIQSLAPCIFVPLTEDPSLPFTPPQGHLEELQETLALIDKHSMAVRANLFNLFTRDAARIAQDARRQDAYLNEPGAHPGDTELGMNPLEMADMISNMEQPPEPGKDYNLEIIPQPDFVNGAVLQNPREWAANQMFRLGVLGATDLEGYERHINQLRSHYEQEIKWEISRQSG